MKAYLVDRLVSRVKELGLEDDYLLRPYDKAKKEILVMALRGDPRPTKSHPLGLALQRYTSPKASDQDYRRLLYSKRPDWFVSQTERANEWKEKLLDLARSGADRPKNGTVLATRLKSYIQLGSSCYDENFAKKIKEIAPGWLVRQSIKDKQTLLEMARLGEEKPHKSTPLGKKLNRYLNPKWWHYDEKFAAKIKEYAPHWIIERKNNVVEKKKQILELAKLGQPKPHCKTELGRAFTSYTSPSQPMFDATFTADLRELRPDWFKK